MLVHTATSTIIFLSAGKLECDIDNPFPIDGIAGCVGRRLETSSLDGTNRGISEPVAEITGNAEDLDGTGGGDAKTNGDDAFNVEFDGLRSILRARFEDDLGCDLGCAGLGTGGLRHRWRSILAEVDHTRGAAWSVCCGTGATRDAELDSDDAGRGIIPAVHVLTAGGAGTKICW